VNRLELLRHIVGNIHVEPLKLGPIAEDQLNQSPFARAGLGPEGNIGYSSLEGRRSRSSPIQYFAAPPSICEEVHSRSSRESFSV
jgi:hypothetical protein